MQRRLIRLVLTLLAGAVSIPSLTGVVIYLYGQGDRAAPADVIIILGAGTRPSGAPSASHARRIRHAAALYRQGFAPYMLCTGGYTARHPNSEARACANYLQDLGIPAEVVLMEERSRSTEENAIEARRVLTEHKLSSAILVSDNYHLLRAEMMFRAQGIQVSLSPAQITAGPLHWHTALTNMFRETAALSWYLFKSALGLPVTDL